MHQLLCSNLDVAVAAGLHHQVYSTFNSGSAAVHRPCISQQGAGLCLALCWLQVASASGGQSRRIRIINMSFAGYVDPTSPDYQATLDMFCAPFNDANKAGVAIFAAAGNYGSSYRGGCEILYSSGCHLWARVR